MKFRVFLICFGITTAFFALLNLRSKATAQDGKDRWVLTHGPNSVMFHYRAGQHKYDLWDDGVIAIRDDANKVVLIAGGTWSLSRR